MFSKSFFAFLLCIPLLGFALEEHHVVRAALDIGSGATKLRVAEVDTEKNKIVKVLLTENFAVSYQDAITNSPDNSFDENIMQEGLAVLKKSQELAENLGAEKVIAVATASFRSATNSQEFIDRIFQETGIQVHIIDQELEGILNFEATSAQVSFPVEHLVVWDIGGGSYQFTTLNHDRDLIVYRGTDASVPFRNHVIKVVKLHDPAHTSTPNPLTAAEIRRSTQQARYFAQCVDREFYEKMADPDTEVVGVGNIFFYGIYPLVGKKTPFTRWDLFYSIQELENKRDEDIGGGPYANVNITNPLLVLGFMQAIGIYQVHIVDINNADGALVYPAFWEEGAAVTK